MKKQALVVVTGAKTSPAKNIFSSGQKVTYLDINGVTHKMNASAGVVRQINDDYELIVCGYNEADGENCAKLGYIDRERFNVVDLLDKEQVTSFVTKIKNLKQELGLPVHLVHYGGASDTSVALPNNSLMAHTWDMQAEALRDLIANNCITLLNLVQEMKRQNIFANQEQSKIIVISAAAAVRAKQMLGLDCAQKGAGHSLLRTMALDLTPENIFVTEIMPGSTDTGFFDDVFTIDTAIDVSKKLGYAYTRETYPVFTAEQIGDAAKYVLNANCNVREIVLLPYGQFPHLGA